ncbi:hypothetical protein WJX72_001989 [[Myrmecia] bisecta]|uniref:histidine kinase n=1 Tax=[Myrmecia] bisecta TaxID=41462 RepID=A0AAW1QEA5_9CHLO
MFSSGGARNGLNSRTTSARRRTTAELLSQGVVKLQQHPGDEKLLPVPLAPAKRVNVATRDDKRGWKIAVIWSIAATVVVAILPGLIRKLLKDVPSGSHLIEAEVPLLFYQASSAAFFSAMVLNLVSLLFEGTSVKRELALLGMFIKGAACYCDVLISLGLADIYLDTQGHPVVTMRYVQWVVTTPTMIYLLSRISDFSQRKIILALTLNTSTIMCGLAANFIPSPWKWCVIGWSMVTFVAVMKLMGDMINSALAVHSDAEARQGMRAIFYATVVVWLAFPLTWFASALNLADIFWTESLILAANFGAKVLFSSSVMYGNFISIQQRRIMAKEIEENLNRMRMVEDLKHAVKTKEDFMSMVSHELRTPLNGIIGLSEALLQGAQQGRLQEKDARYIKTIKNSSYHLANIINDILDAASLSKGKLTLKIEKVSIGKVVEHCLDIVGQLAKENVAVHKIIDPATPAIEADGSRVLQILYNLMGNALKFTARGSVKLWVRPAAEGKGVLISVQDTGCGVAKEHHEVIFEAFGQGDMSTTRKYGGTGLGLHIVSQMVAAHGGSITLDSEVGKGSTFTVLLPLKAPEDAGSRRNSTVSKRTSVEVTPEIKRKPTVSPKSFSHLPGQKKRHSEVHGSVLILSVDDEPVNHMVIEDLLTRQGYKMHQELDARMALDWIEASDTLPDLILLDCMMPNMSGHEMCKELRKTVPKLVVPVIMLSAKNDEKNVVEGLENGCNDFVSKPVKRAELMARIGAHLKTTEYYLLHALADGGPVDDSAMSILKNILPEHIIEKIQETGLEEGTPNIGQAHQHVVVLFSDIVGFSTISSTMPAKDVFVMLTNLFSSFDRLVDRFGVYKVETIGDGYMIAAGHAETPEMAAMGRPIDRMVGMAKAMLEVIKSFKLPDSTACLQIRIGINCGPAYSGVIGMKCPRYCFLGDTVNMASRMESNGFPMCIHVSHNVVEDMKHSKEQFAPLGERFIKGKGSMLTYLIKFGDWEMALEHFKNGGSPGQSLHETHDDTRSLLKAGVERAASFKKLSEEVDAATKALQDEKKLRRLDEESMKKLQDDLTNAQANLEAERKLVAHIQQELHAVTAQHTATLAQHNASMASMRSKAATPAPSMALAMVPARHGPVLPRHSYSVRMLLEDLGLQNYAPTFETQAVGLGMLLSMSSSELEALGVRVFGHRQAIKEAVVHFVKEILDECEDAAIQEGLLSPHTVRHTPMHAMIEDHQSTLSGY